MNALFHVEGLIFGVTLLAFNIAFIPCDYLRMRRDWSFGERLIKVSYFETILKCFHDYFLVLMEDSYDGFIET